MKPFRHGAVSEKSAGELDRKDYARAFDDHSLQWKPGAENCPRNNADMPPEYGWIPTPQGVIIILRDGEKLVPPGDETFIADRRQWLETKNKTCP